MGASDANKVAVGRRAMAEVRARASAKYVPVNTEAQQDMHILHVHDKA